MRGFYPLFFGITGMFILIYLWSPDRDNILREAAKIGIIVVMNVHEVDQYERSLDSLKCYSQIYGYTLIFIYEHLYAGTCRQQSVLSRRQCIVADYLENYEYLLVLDPSMGVVNPKRRIEEFIDRRFDVTFYEKIHTQEIVPNSFLLKNTKFSWDFIKDMSENDEFFANSENRSFSAKFQMYVLQRIFAMRHEKCSICEELRNNSKDSNEISMLDSAVQMMLGSVEEFGKLRIMRKNDVWAREAAITNSLWNADSDFIMSGWKMENMKTYSHRHLPISLYRRDNTSWYDPILGEFNLDYCAEWNTTWNYDLNLIISKHSIYTYLTSMRNLVQLEGFKTLSKISSLL